MRVITLEKSSLNSELNIVSDTCKSELIMYNNYGYAYSFAGTSLSLEDVIV